MQKAAMVRESIAATIFLAQGVGSNLGYQNPYTTEQRWCLARSMPHPSKEI